MVNKDFIAKLLSINQPITNSPVRFSSIALLLKGARKLFGCNIETGKYELLELNEDNFNSGLYVSMQFCGLINYLIFLEQIGSIFKPKNKQSNYNSNGIGNALHYFSSLDVEPEKINAIVSLRNSLVHRFGLATVNNPKNRPARKFTLSIDRNSDIISNPIQDWNGDFSDKSINTLTTVFIIDLVEIIKKVYSKIKVENDKDMLEVVLEGGLDEMKARYTIVI